MNAKKKPTLRNMQTYNFFSFFPESFEGVQVVWRADSRVAGGGRLHVPGDQARQWKGSHRPPAGSATPLLASAGEGLFPLPLPLPPIWRQRNSCLCTLWFPPSKKQTDAHIHWMAAGALLAKKVMPGLREFTFPLQVTTVPKPWDISAPVKTWLFFTFSAFFPS